MGSYGGATTEGQKAKFDALGVNERIVGCEIRATMAGESNVSLGYEMKGNLFATERVGDCANGQLFVAVAQFRIGD